MARLFVANHAGQATTVAAVRFIVLTILLGGLEQRHHQRVHRRRDAVLAAQSDDHAVPGVVSPWAGLRTRSACHRVAGSLRAAPGYAPRSHRGWSLRSVAPSARPTATHSRTMLRISSATPSWCEIPLGFEQHGRRPRRRCSGTASSTPPWCEVIGLPCVEVGMREQRQELRAVVARRHHQMCRRHVAPCVPAPRRSAGRSIITGTMRSRSMCCSKRCTCSTPFWITATSRARTTWPWETIAPRRRCRRPSWRPAPSRPARLAGLR